MKWRPEYYHDSSGIRKRLRRDRQKLIIDKDAHTKWRKEERGDTEKNEGGGGTDESPKPENSEAYEILNAEDRPRPEGWSEEFVNALTESHRLSLHVIDVKRCQVISLMDITKIGDNDNPVGFINIEGENILAEYGWGLPKLFYDEDYDMHENFITVQGTLRLSRDIVYTNLNFEFTYRGDSFKQAPKSYVCSYLRAMMNATSPLGRSRVTTGAYHRLRSLSFFAYREICTAYLLFPFYFFPFFFPFFLPFLLIISETADESRSSSARSDAAACSARASASAASTSPDFSPPPSANDAANA